MCVINDKPQNKTAVLVTGDTITIVQEAHEDLTKHGCLAGQAALKQPTRLLPRVLNDGAAA